MKKSKLGPHNITLIHKAYKHDILLNLMGCQQDINEGQNCPDQTHPENCT